MSEEDDSWKSPALREAEAQLDEALVRSDELQDEIDQMNLPPLEPRVATEEQVEAVKAQADDPKAVPAMRVIKQLVAGGEFTWEDVVLGKAYAHPRVQEAMATDLGQFREVYQEFEEGHTFDEVLEARGISGAMTSIGPGTTAPAGPSADDEDASFEERPVFGSGDTPPAPKPKGPRHARPDDDDDYFGGSPFPG
ncbi:hypothetical protein [Amycolatopsis minnesotensis]|uniref:Uncharacterized protein n=1 Tax=Amycolatopsis minnesotensis TaxID=337894 RepID=A0ABP5EEJ5_9PSEU